MKKVFSYTLLALYIINIFGVLWPYLEYATNKEYIAKVLCINQDKKELNCEGKCFLAERIKTGQEQKDKDTSLNNEEVKLYCFQAEPQLPLNSFKPNSIFPQNNKTIHFQTYYSGIFHPPQIS